MKTLSIFSTILMFGIFLSFSSCAKDDTYDSQLQEQDEMLTTRGIAERPFKGKYITDPKPLGPPTPDGWIILSIESEGQATHLGNSTWTAVQKVNIFANPQIIYGLKFFFTAANGDKIWGWYDGEGTTDFVTGIVSFSGKMYVTGGSGRFDDVEGELPYYGEASLTEGGFVVFEEGYLKY